MYVCMHVCMYVCWKIAIYLDAQEVEKLIIIDLLTYQVPENLYITVIIHPFQHTLWVVHVEWSNFLRYQYVVLWHTFLAFDDCLKV